MRGRRAAARRRWASGCRRCAQAPARLARDEVSAGASRAAPNAGSALAGTNAGAVTGTRRRIAGRRARFSRWRRGLRRKPRHDHRRRNGPRRTDGNAVDQGQMQRSRKRKGEKQSQPVLARHARLVIGPGRMEGVRQNFAPQLVVPLDSSFSIWAAEIAPGTRSPLANTIVGVALIPRREPNSTNLSTGLSQVGAAVGAIPFCR